MFPEPSTWTWEAAADSARAARPRRCSPLRCRLPGRTRRPLQGRTRSVGMVAGRIGMVDHPRTTQATPPAHGTDCVHVRPSLGHLPSTRADQMAAPIIERPTRSCTPASPPPSTTSTGDSARSRPRASFTWSPVFSTRHQRLQRRLRRRMAQGRRRTHPTERQPCTGRRAPDRRSYHRGLH